MTITRLADDRFYFVTGSALGVRDRSTLERHLPDGGGVEIVDHTSATAVLNLCGPRRATCWRSSPTLRSTMRTSPT